MTDQRPLLPVVQSDRDAASATAFAYRGLKHANWQKRISEGRCDDGEIVQAFARHRLTAEQDGWVRVPVEPTEVMKEAATEVDIKTGRGHLTALNWEEAQQVWSAMIAARPANILDSTKEAGL